MVVVSYPSLYTTLDLRDQSIQPHKGLFFGNQLEVAGLGGDARDVKVQPEVRAYVPVTKRMTLALRGSVGLLFAQNYGKTIENNALHKIAPGDPAAEGWRKDWVKDIQLMFLRGLFAGGPGSNRGYTSREIGPHGQVPFYNHGQSLESVAMLGSVDCTQPNAKTVHPAVCDVPLGGFTLWEASIELRYPIEGALSGTLFTDAADVSYSLLSFRWRPHLSSGAGLRYDTPVGAIRFDLGFRLPGLQHPPNAPDEGVPNAGLLGLPMAATFGIGEAY
jgi:outer membrane protein insertion porin family/translocation and assembly module TamA